MFEYKIDITYYGSNTSAVSIGNVERKSRLGKNSFCSFNRMCDIFVYIDNNLVARVCLNDQQCHASKVKLMGHLQWHKML